jgi:hypothetical protein
MAGILTLRYDLSLDILRTHLRFATARLKSDPNAASYVAGFTAFLTQWAAADAQEMANEDAVTDALAAAVGADTALDALVDAVNLAINGAKKPSASNPQQKLYFGGTAPSKFRAPILGNQLKDMQQWPALLGQSTVPALKTLAAQATTAVANGTAAATAVASTQATREAWNNGGPREALFAAFNALCATAHGGLKAFALATPLLGLPTDYAETFFQHTAPSPYGTTVTEAAAALASAQKKVTIVQKHHDTLAAKEATRASEITAKTKAKAALVTAKAATKAAKTAQKAAEEAARKKVRK